MYTLFKVAEKAKAAVESQLEQTSEELKSVQQSKAEVDKAKKKLDTQLTEEKARNADANRVIESHSGKIVSLQVRWLGCQFSPSQLQHSSFVILLVFISPLWDF